LVGIIVEEQRNLESATLPQCFLGGKYLGDVLNVVGSPEFAVKSPWASKFERYPFARFGLIPVCRCERYGTGHNPFENVSCSAALYQRLAQDEVLRLLVFVKIALRKGFLGWEPFRLR
jgi:hypothetical protein